MLQDIRIRQRDYLIKIAQILTQELEIEPLLWQVLQMAVDLVGGESGFIALYNVRKGWQIQTQLNISEANLAYIENCLSGMTDVFAEADDFTDIMAINLLIKRMRSLNDPDIADGIGFPLMLQKKLIGAIVVFRSYKVSFSANEKVIMKSFTDQAAIAINNATLYSENLEEKKRLDAIIKAVADGLMVMNVSHKVTLVNPSLRRMLNLESVNIANCYHDDLIRFKTIDSGIELDEAEVGGWPLSPESRHTVQGAIYQYGSEKTVPVNITYTPIMSSNNRQILNIIALVRDISKFKEADDLKNTFISTISHELKTPVAIIKGYASTLNLQDADWDQETIRESLNVIEEEADRLTGMINDLLDASRFYAGTLKLHRIDFLIPELAESVRKHMQPQCGENKILVDFPEEFPMVNADEDRIRQVLTNLISNAIKYAAGSDILIKGETVENFVEVSVIDGGPGLSAETAKHAFDRFYRAKETFNQVKGTGLGLFLCKAIVEAHGGKIRAGNRTDVEHGAVFSFTLPLESDGKQSSIDFSEKEQF